MAFKVSLSTDVKVNESLSPPIVLLSQAKIHSCSCSLLLWGPLRGPTSGWEKCLHQVIWANWLCQELSSSFSRWKLPGVLLTSVVFYNEFLRFWERCHGERSLSLGRRHECWTWPLLPNVRTAGWAVVSPCPSEDKRTDFWNHPKWSVWTLTDWPTGWLQHKTTPSFRCSMLFFSHKAVALLKASSKPASVRRSVKVSSVAICDWAVLLRSKLSPCRYQ